MAGTGDGNEEYRKQREPIEGLVAQVLNERELVINRGRLDGVEEGMIFAVLAQSKLTITDPLSNEVLGILDQEKVRVRATQVHPRLSVCRTFRSTVTGGALGLGSQMAELFGPQRRVYETFDAEKESHPRPLPIEESYVKIRDRVRQIKGVSDMTE